MRKPAQGFTSVRRKPAPPVRMPAPPAVTPPPLPVTHSNAPRYGNVPGVPEGPPVPPPVPHKGCPLPGCGRDINKPTKYQYCSNICKAMDMFMHNVKQSLNNHQSEEAAAIIADAEGTIKQMISINQRRLALRKHHQGT